MPEASPPLFPHVKRHCRVSKFVFLAEQFNRSLCWIPDLHRGLRWISRKNTNIWPQKFWRAGSERNRAVKAGWRSLAQAYLRLAEQSEKKERGNGDDGILNSKGR